MSPIRNNRSSRLNPGRFTPRSKTPARHSSTTSKMHIFAHVPDEQEKHASADVAPHLDSLNSVSMLAEDRKRAPIITESSESVSTTQFHDAQGIKISGRPQFLNVSTNNGSLVMNNHSGTHDLAKLEKFVSTDALYNSAAQDPTCRCHPETRVKVLGQLRDWIDNPNTAHRIFWLHGPAGAGKSAIAQTIAHADEDGQIAATFFFHRSDPNRSNGNRLFPTLAMQLASIPAVKDSIVQMLDKSSHLPKLDVETQFKRLLAHPFQATNDIASQMPHPAPVVIIEGVDECSDEQLQRRILTIVGEAVKDRRFPLRFLICSRQEALIEDVLDQFKDITQIDLAALDDSNHDIQKYLMYQFSNIASKCGLPQSWPGQEIIKDFVHKSSRNFIFAATIMRYISDEDCMPESQLAIVRNLKPSGKKSPFAPLDELYLEILGQQRDQEFLKKFLALLVGRISVIWSRMQDPVSNEDATLMNVSYRELSTKLRRMRSLVKFNPFIVHHNSFLDFLQDSSRSGQYHVSKQSGQKRYLELIVDCIDRHISEAIEQPNRHQKCRTSPGFKFIVQEYPPKIVMPVEDWKEALMPLLALQDRLLKTLHLRPCHYLHVMRNFLLHLEILQGNSQDISAAQTPDSYMDETVAETGQNIPEKDLEKCLSVLLSCPPILNSVLTVDMIDHMSSLLSFDSAEIVAKIGFVADAQKLINLIDSLINDHTFLSHCGRDVPIKAALLASKVFERVPLLPRSVLLNGPPKRCDWLQEHESNRLNYMCQIAFISRILDHDYVLPGSWICQGDEYRFVFYGNMLEQYQSVDKWLKQSSPDFVTRIRVVLEIARTIRYIHSMDSVVALFANVIKQENFALDSNLRAKAMFRGYFAWQIKERLTYHLEGSRTLDLYTHKSHISAFGNLFRLVCFNNNNDNFPKRLVENANHLIGRCCAKDPLTMNNLTMDDIIKEMERWDLT